MPAWCGIQQWKQELSMQNQLFEAALGIARPWYVRGIDFDAARKVLTIGIDFVAGSRVAAPGVEGVHPVHDTQTKRLRHLNFFQHECYLEVRTPRVKLPDGRVVQIEPDWFGKLSGFTLLFEALVRLNPGVRGSPLPMNRGKRPSIVVDNRRRSIPAWQDRNSDPSLTVLLALQLCAIFVAAPLAAKGLPMARMVADTLVLAVLAIVVMLSRKWGAIVVILLGLAATVASFLPPGEWSPVLGTIARHG